MRNNIIIALTHTKRKYIKILLKENCRRCTGCSISEYDYSNFA